MKQILHELPPTLTLYNPKQKIILVGISFALLLFAVPTNLSAQQIPLFFQPEQDCPNAIPLCNGMYSTNDYYLGFGNDFEVLPVQNCSTGGEINAVWFVFSIEQSGTLGFSINTDEDYDFLLWDITQYGCATLGQEEPMRCNFSNDDGNTGLNPATTVNAPLGVGSGGSAFMPGLDVQAGHTYALMLNWLFINPFTYDGFDIQFSGTADVVTSTSPAPTFTVASCNPGQPLLLQCNAPMDCATIASLDFTMPGATITNVEGVGCGSFTTQIEVEYTLTAPATSNFTLTATGVTNICGTNMNHSETFTFPAPITLNASAAAICGGENTPVTLTSNVAGTWSNGDVGTSTVVNPIESTVYSIEVNNGFCSRTESILVVVYPDAFAEISPTNPATCTGGDAVLNVIAPAGSSINWSGGGINGASNGTSINASPSGNTVYSVNITTAEGCTASNSTTVFGRTCSRPHLCQYLRNAIGQHRWRWFARQSRRFAYGFGYVAMQ